jgi:bifunctional ADP-heptose synthase (sugar kinase/adenylyltransferase)
MKSYDTRSCGYKLRFNGPESVEEYDQKAKKPGQCLEDAINNTIYRGTLPEWQDEFARVLAKETGVAREVDAEATAKLKARAKGEVKDIPERFKAYNARVKATWANGDEAKEKQLGDWAQSAADKIEVDPSPSDRVSAAQKGDLAKASDILDHETDYIEAKVSKMLAKVPEYELARDEEGKPELTSLARLIARWIEAELTS